MLFYFRFHQNHLYCWYYKNVSSNQTWQRPSLIRLEAYSWCTSTSFEWFMWHLASLLHCAQLTYQTKLHWFYFRVTPCCRGCRHCSVDDRLSGADTPEEATELHQQLLMGFSCANGTYSDLTPPPQKTCHWTVAHAELCLSALVLIFDVERSYSSPIHCLQTCVFPLSPLRICRNFMKIT